MTADRAVSGALGTALCVPLALAACGTGEAAIRAERTDSAGVEIVTSPATARALNWTFTPRVRIGGADSGAASFYEIYPNRVAADAASRIFVVDANNFRLAAFDTTGRTLWAVGREGAGPGEFKSPSSVFVSGDTVTVVDASGPKLEAFSVRDGVYLGSVRLAVPFVLRIAATEFGALAEYVTRGEGGRTHRELAIVRGRDTVAIASYPSAEGTKMVRFPECPVMLRMGPLFSPSVHWVASRDRLFVSNDVDYRIAVYADTAVVRSIRRAVPAVEATAELAGAENPDGFEIKVPSAGLDCRMSGEDMAKLVGFAPVVPAVRYLAVAPDGTLWVRRNPSKAKLGTFDLFGRDGAYIGTVHDVPAPVAFLPDGSVLGIEKDEMDVQRVVVYGVTR